MRVGLCCDCFPIFCVPYFYLKQASTGKRIATKLETLWLQQCINIKGFHDKQNKHFNDERQYYSPCASLFRYNPSCYPEHNHSIMSSRTNGVHEFALRCSESIKSHINYDHYVKLSEREKDTFATNVANSILSHLNLEHIYFGIMNTGDSETVYYQQYVYVDLDDFLQYVDTAIVTAADQLNLRRDYTELVSLLPKR